MRELARGLIARRLPSFSVLGRKELEDGLLMTTGGAERDVERLARRMVLMIQRIAEGENPSTFDVSFPTEQRLIINMQTAREIGFSPRWEYLTDAEQLFTRSRRKAAATLSLLEAMRAALTGESFARSRAGHASASSADDVRIARSNLLPSLDVSAARTQIDDGPRQPAHPAREADERGSAVPASAVFRKRMGRILDIAASLQAAEEAERQDMLDTLESAASAT